MEGMPSPSLSPRRLAPSVREGAKSGHDLDRNGTESGHSRTETASLRQIQQGIPTGLEGAKTRTRADFRAFAPGWAPSLSVSPPGFSGNRGGQGDAGVFRGRCPGKGTSGGFGGSSFLSRLEKPGTTRVLGSKRRETPIGRSFYTRDHLGSIRELTDSTQAVRARYDYDAYGRMTKISGDKDSPIGFAGMPWHPQSGLNLALFRAYDPNLGRWLSRDPIAEYGGLNLYGYVGNNPVNWRDPSGLAPGDKWWGHDNRDFQNWAHDQKGGRGYDFDRDEVEELWDEWNSLGKPKPRKDPKYKPDKNPDCDGSKEPAP